MRIAQLAPGAVLAASAAFPLYRRWHLGWGATPAERLGPMPGDALLPRAAFVATRAITIGAPPEDVWPWIVQAGFGRAGFYSYDLLDNLGRRSATTILPEHQHADVGDVAAPMANPPDERTAFTVVQVDPPRTLVWSKPDSTWAWLLRSEAPDRTRLVTRLKARYEAGPFLPVTLLLMEVGDFPMMRRMLLGIRDRAEATQRPGAGSP